LMVRLKKPEVLPWLLSGTVRKSSPLPSNIPEPRFNAISRLREESSEAAVIGNANHGLVGLGDRHGDWEVIRGSVWIDWLDNSAEGDRLRIRTSAGGVRLAPRLRTSSRAGLTGVSYSSWP
jgi:hypothetical protein